MQSTLPKARLVLEDGSEYDGFSFGAARSASGEMIFNTSVVGYCELLTDPTLAGQLLTLTWPLVGNSGVPPKTEDRGVRQYFESNRIWPRGLVVSEYSPEYSHWNAATNLAGFLKDEGVPAITGVDTRALAKRIREKGTLLGKILVDTAPNTDEIASGPFEDPRRRNLIEEVSCREIISYEPDESEKRDAGGSVVHVVLVDCGVKNNVIRNLLRRGARVTRVPWNHDFTDMDYDGLLTSNGPGDPSFAATTVSHIRKAFEIGKPIFGICMGNLLLARAAGAETFRLRFGHHSSNQPVLQAGTDRTHVTPQNHGFAVDPLRLSGGWEQWFTNINDGTCEGIRHKTKPFFSVQYHPEGCGGPKNAENIYDLFFTYLRRRIDSPL